MLQQSNKLATVYKPDFSNELLLSTPEKPVKVTEEPWFDVNSPKTIWVFGEKKSGKGVMIDQFVRWLRRAGFALILHLYDAGGYESLYYTVNKNCKARWQQWRIQNQNNPEALETEGLHCACFQPIPITWMMPSYGHVDEKAVDRFNGCFWSGFDEYNEAYIQCKVNEYLPPSFDFTSIRKPDSLIPPPILTIRKFTVPTTPSRIDEFRRQFRAMVIESRDYHRLLVNTQSSYPSDHQGKVEKYTTIAEIMRFLPDLAQIEFAKKNISKPRDEWTIWEKSYHKIAIIANEIREFAPSSRLSGDPESAISKRAWFNFIPKSRHNKSWVFGDLQSPADLFVGVRNQDDLQIIKRNTLKRLGEELKDFYFDVEKHRAEKITGLTGTEDMRFVSQDVLDFVNMQRPSVTEIPDNRAYVIFGNGMYKLVRCNMSSWHHKSDRDDFYADTGITYTITPTRKVVEISEAQATITSKKRKVNKDEEMILIKHMREDGKSYEDIIQYFQQKAREEQIPDSKWFNQTPKKVSNRFTYWIAGQKEKQV